MHYVKITTDGETRWINLARVSRVTVAKNPTSGDEILALVFADAQPDELLKIHGTTAADRNAIERLVTALDHLAATAETR